MTPEEASRLTHALLPRVPMRLLIAIAGILLGSLLSAAPAYAHAAPKATAEQSAPPASTPKAAPEREPLLGVCELPRERFIAVDAPDPAETHPHSDGEAHNPADHSHPLGSDTFHDKASHGSLDVAHDSRAVAVAAAVPAKPAEPTGDDPPCGIVLKPPVPPPLG